MIELVVALGLGAIISLTLYTLTSGTSQIFYEQQRIAASQLALRSAVERLRAEIGRAGYLATPNSDVDPDVCPPGSLDCPNPPLRGVQLLNQDPVAAAAIPEPGTNIVARPDELTIFGAFDDGDSYFTTSLGAGMLELDNTTQSFQQRFGAAVIAGNIAAVIADSFNANRVLRIQCPGQSAVFQAITGPATWTGSTVQVPYGMLNAVGPYQPAGIGWRCEVSTATFARYHVRNVCALFPATCRAGGEPDKTDLIRVDLTPALVEIAGTERIVAEYAVDFDVSFDVDTAATPAVPGTVNPPVVQQCSFASSAAWAVGGAGSLAGRVRAVLFRLSVRTRNEDPSFPWVANPGLPLVRFKLRPVGTTTAACRVRTISTRVELPNFAAANIQSPTSAGAPCM
ncbi:MAG: hypothetical protein HYY06_31170 [Deltaproteobacteria bacterium]|nr:hypothetical protein [Deltaproteobacteria bacterium]